MKDPQPNPAADEYRNHQEAHKNEETIVHKSADKNTWKWTL